MDTGTRSLRSAFRKGSCRDWPLAIGFSLFLQLRVVRRDQRTANELPCSAIRQTNGPHQRRGTELTYLNMWVRLKPESCQLMTYVSIPRQPSVRIDPLPAGLAPHPGQLPLRQLARRRNGPLHPLLQGVLPVEVRPQLPVAHRAHRRMTGRESASAAQPHHLLEKARRHHRIETPGDPLVQHGSPPGRKNPVAQWPAGERADGRALQLRDRPSGGVTDFERTLD